MRSTAERPPVVAIEVERDEVPTIAQRHEAVRFDVATAGAFVPGAVVESQSLLAPGGHRQRHQHGDVGRLVIGRAGCRPAEANGHLAERIDALAERARHDLHELGQRGDGSLAEHRLGGARELTQADRDGNGLVVVEQQRRQPAARAEGVAAEPTGRALDRVAEAAQARDVTPEGPWRDLQAIRQFLR